MRLWHKDLIHYLPRQQLIAQWRECCAICSNWANKGTPNHLLVNKVMDYPTVHFMEYTRLVVSEMGNRGYKINPVVADRFVKNFDKIGNSDETIIGANVERVIFNNWHDERYLKQCLFNLQEKYDCGGITEDEWLVISNEFGKYLYY